MKQLVIAAVAIVMAATSGSSARQTTYRTLNDTFAPPKFTSVEEWKGRAAYLREHILASAGLLPMPDKTPLNPVVFDDTKGPADDYTVSKVYFESLPGFFVTGNLYRPSGTGPFPAVLSPHGHWAYGRLENSATASVPGRAINLARQGFVVFTFDMIGYNDSRQLTHAFGGRRENLWSLSLAGLQLWNSIRVVDFLETLPYVRRDAIGATGASGGGTQTFLLAAVDDRVAVAAPVNMISLSMQGGCLCENLPGLRLDTTNVEIASTIAPRPLLMVSATGDWTKNTMEQEYPAVRSIYALFGAPERVHAIRVDAEHNYNRASREAMYAWMARWLQQAPADVSRPERGFTPPPLADALVFHQRTLPPNAVSAEQLTENWIAASRRQLASTSVDVRGRALAHVLGVDDSVVGPGGSPTSRASRTVLFASADTELERLLKQAGVAVRMVRFAPFDEEAAGKIRHFETYNRTAAGQRVAEIVAAARANPGAVLVADGDSALPGLLAAAVSPLSLAVLDVGGFDGSTDAAFVERLYLPGLRRAGDIDTASRLAKGDIVIHNAAPGFTIGEPRTGSRVRAEKMTAREIATLIRTGTRRAPRS
jgi:dienelactone hydrolase